MYDETKKAVNKTLFLTRKLYFLGEEKYNKLVDAINNITKITPEELNNLVTIGYSLDDAILKILKQKYMRAAVLSGFDEEYGLLMLELAALLEELNN